MRRTFFCIRAKPAVTETRKAFPMQCWKQWRPAFPCSQPIMAESRKRSKTASAEFWSRSAITRRSPKLYCRRCKIEIFWRAWLEMARMLWRRNSISKTKSAGLKKFIWECCSRCPLGNVVLAEMRIALRRAKRLQPLKKHCQLFSDRRKRNALSRSPLRFDDRGCAPGSILEQLEGAGLELRGRGSLS